jgi:hypothetical protein
VLVCALSSPSEAVACALTESNGEYAIAGVPAGGYVIGFDAAKPYKVQYYNDQATYAAAQPVQVVLGTDTSDIGAVMQGPAESGPPPPPPDLPPPPKPVTLVPQQPVSSESGAGASPQPSPSTAGASTPASTATLAPAQAPPVVTAPTSKIVISGSTAALLLSCSDATCRGTIELTSQVMTSRHEGGKVASHRETLVLARGYFSLAKGKSVAAVLHLTAAGRRQLAQVKRHLFAANLILSVEGGKTITKAVMAS